MFDIEFDLLTAIAKFRTVKERKAGRGTTLAIDRLRSETEETVSILGILSRLPPRSVDLTTAQDLLKECLRRQDERLTRPKQALQCHRGYSDLIAHILPLDILAVDYGATTLARRPYVTAISHGNCGRFVAFTLGFGIPTWTEVADALHGHSLGLRSINIMEGAAA